MPRKPTRDLEAEAHRQSSQSSRQTPSQPSPIVEVDAVSSEVGQGQPTLLPPAEEAAEGAIGVWLNDKRINALWAKAENRNAWAAITGVGWKKLANNSDSAIVALTILASHARQLNSRVDYREEADGMIRELYVY